MSTSRILQLLPAPNETQTVQLSHVQNFCITYQNFDHPPELSSRMNACLGEEIRIQNKTEFGIILYALESDEDSLVDIRACEVLLLFRNTLSRMTGLHTFRLHMEMKAANTREMEALYLMTTKAILLALPISITTLDIDIQGERPRFSVQKLCMKTTPYVPQRGQTGICTILLSPKFLPSLRHLRIRLRQLCLAFFLTIICLKRRPYRHLETIVVNMCLTDRYQTGSNHAYIRSIALEDCAVSENDLPDRQPSSSLHSGNIISAVRSRARGRLPSLKSFKYMYPKRREQLDLDDDPTMVQLEVTELLVRKSRPS